MFYAWLIKTPNVTVKLCGSVTLGEKFAPHFIEAIASDHGANKIKKSDNKDKNNITIDANFPKTKDKKDNPFQGLVRFIVDYGGTNDGIEKLKQNKCDIALASEDVDIERNDFDRVLLGQDTIAIIVNDNKNETLHNFDSQKIKSILENQQDNNKDEQWQVFCREKSGTTDTIIKKLELQDTGASFLNNCSKVTTNKEMWDKVTTTSNDGKPSIGYLSYSFVVDKSYSDRKKYLTTIDNQKPVDLLSNYFENKDTDKLDDIYFTNNKYKLNRELSFYTHRVFNSTQLKDIDIINSIREDAGFLGQKILNSEGFVSVSLNGITANQNPKDKKHKQYTQETMKNLYKIIRQRNKPKPIYTQNFLEGYTTIENQEDLQKWLSTQNNNTEFVLIGHASPVGSPRYNLGLSLQRTEYIENILLNNGYQNVKTYAFGNEYPSEETKVARVEIYDLKEIDKIYKEINSATK
ncbi:substrate-binding domain-containing protein [Anabaena sp. AL93]|uniref:substrate-binding domain-containing protein n=1 Tax=Anabaena sp. AL93 TaxID=1678133 RepID=UPI0025BBA9FA|nr:substrate-binding domain-containing protein [Anabaena sp. AL93]